MPCGVVRMNNKRTRARVLVLTCRAYMDVCVPGRAGPGLMHRELTSNAADRPVPAATQTAPAGIFSADYGPYIA